MALILNIESSTTMCSVCLGGDGQVIAVKELNDGYTHAENLPEFIESVLEFSSIRPESLDAIAVSMGPGSYTGLRIGLSLAKGLCYSLNIPLLEVSTLKAMTSLVDKSYELYCPMLDARRMEVYSAIYDKRGNEVIAPSPVIIDSDSYKDELDHSEMVFFGPGAEKCIGVIDHVNAVFLKDIFPSSSGMVRISESLFTRGIFGNLAYSVPLYLK